MKMIKRYNKDSGRFESISASYCGDDDKMRMIIKELRKEAQQEDNGEKYRLVSCYITVR